MSLDNLINVEKYKSAEIPMEDWNIIGVFGDILMCRFMDAADGGEGGDYILRGGIAVPLDVTKHAWRIVEVLQRGAKTTDEIQVGDLLMIPSDRGLPFVQKRDGKSRENLIFINEDRVFCKVSPRAEAQKKAKR